MRTPAPTNMKVTIAVLHDNLEVTVTTIEAPNVITALQLLDTRPFLNAWAATAIHAYIENSGPCTLEALVKAKLWP